MPGCSLYVSPSLGLVAVLLMLPCYGGGGGVFSLCSPLPPVSSLSSLCVCCPPSLSLMLPPPLSLMLPPPPPLSYVAPPLCFQAVLLCCSPPPSLSLSLPAVLMLPPSLSCSCSLYVAPPSPPSVLFMFSPLSVLIVAVLLCCPTPLSVLWLSSL